MRVRDGYVESSGVVAITAEVEIFGYNIAFGTFHHLERDDGASNGGLENGAIAKWSNL